MIQLIPQNSEKVRGHVGEILQTSCLKLLPSLKNEMEEITRNFAPQIADVLIPQTIWNGIHCRCNQIRIYNLVSKIGFAKAEQGTPEGLGHQRHETAPMLQAAAQGNGAAQPLLMREFRRELQWQQVCGRSVAPQGLQPCVS